MQTLALSVGRQATATDAITEVNLTQIGEVQKYSDLEDTGGGLLLRGVNGDLRLANHGPRRARASMANTTPALRYTLRRLVALSTSNRVTCYAHGLDS